MTKTLMYGRNRQRPTLSIVGHAGRVTIDLQHHGDAEVADGLVDLAVNVRRAPMPDWLADPVRASLGRLAAYPDGSAATAAVAARHRRDPGEVLLTAGAAQGFVLIAQ